MFFFYLIFMANQRKFHASNSNIFQILRFLFSCERRCSLLITYLIITLRTSEPALSGAFFFRKLLTRFSPPPTYLLLPALLSVRGLKCRSFAFCCPRYVTAEFICAFFTIYNYNLKINSDLNFHSTVSRFESRFVLLFIWINTFRRRHSFNILLVYPVY